MRVTVWGSRSGEYIEMDEATSLPLDATEDRYLGLVNGKRLGEQGTKWSVTIMQERLFPHAPCPRSCSLKDSKYPYVTGQPALGPFTCHLFVARINIKMPDGCNVFSNATSIYTLLLVQKDSASRRLVSLVHQEPGGGRGPMIWRRPPNPIPLPELEPRFWLSPPM
jgi:hypothetical protein